MSMFESLGQFAGMMKNLQGMKTKMAALKEELAHQEFSAKSTNGQVEVVLSGDMTVKRITVTPAFASCGDIALIEDTLTETVNAVIETAKMTTAQKLSEVTGGVDLSALGLN